MKKAIFLVHLVLISVIAVFVTFEYYVMFSGFAAGLLKAAMVIGIIFAFDHFVIGEIDTIDELKKGNTAFAIFFLAICLLFSSAVATAQDNSECKETPLHLLYAQTQIGVIEEPDNTGPDVKKYLNAVGLDEGYPYCAAFVAWSLDRGEVAYPTVRSALATNYITEHSIPVSLILRTNYSVNVGDILVFRKGNTVYGHTGFIMKEENDFFLTVEANTSPGRYGSQRDGQGVYMRKRGFESMSPANYFRATHVTPVLYPVE